MDQHLTIHPPTLDISIALEALRFGQGNHTLYQTIINQFRKVANDQLSALLDSLQTQAPTLRAQIIQHMDDMDKALLHPELLHHLFYVTQPVDAGNFVLTALEAQQARRQRQFDTTRYDYIWSTNGDYMLRYDQTTGHFREFEGFLLNDRTPLDFFSPYCIKVSGKELFEADQEISEYDYQEAYSIYSQLFDCFERLRDAPDIEDLIGSFSAVIMLKKQRSTTGERHFFSSTDGLYVGRTILGNPDIASQEMLIDSLVHESTHALLYMIDERFPWQPAPAVSDRLGNRLRSPWSGNLLSVRNYLQAIFVWYTLFNLWNELGSPFGTQRLHMIREGFGKVDIAEAAARFETPFSETLINTVEAAKKYVLNN